MNIRRVQQMRKPPLDRPMIKYEAKRRLSTAYGKAFLACLMPLAVSLIVQLIPGHVGPSLVLGNIPTFGEVYYPAILFAVALAAQLFITGPMAVRVSGYFLQLNRGTPLPSPLTIADCFDAGYWRLFRGMLLQHIHITLFSYWPMLVGLVIPGFVPMEWTEAGLLIHTNEGFWLLLMCCNFLQVYAIMRYAMVPYVLYDQPELSVREALRESFTLTRGRVWELIVLALSFIGWTLLETFAPMFGPVLGPVVGMMYRPYLEATMASYYIGFMDALYGVEAKADEA